MSNNDNDINKGALFLHLDKGIAGTYVGKHKSAEAGFVYIEYVPFMKRMFSFPKKVKMKHAVAEDHIHVVNNTMLDELGLEPNIVFIFSGEVGSAVRFMETENLDKIKKLKGQIDILKAEVSTANEKAKKAVSGMASGLAASRDAVKPSRSDAPSNPFMNRFGGSRINNSDDNYESFD